MLVQEEEEEEGEEEEEREIGIDEKFPRRGLMVARCISPEREKNTPKIPEDESKNNPLTSVAEGK